MAKADLGAVSALVVAAKVKASLDPILIVNDNSVFKNLFA